MNGEDKVMAVIEELQERCLHCGTSLAVEREMFSQDKLFIEHSCAGTILAKERIDQKEKALTDRQILNRLKKRRQDGDNSVTGTD